MKLQMGMNTFLENVSQPEMAEESAKQMVVVLDYALKLSKKVILST